MNSEKEQNTLFDITPPSSADDSGMRAGKEKRMRSKKRKEVHEIGDTLQGDVVKMNDMIFDVMWSTMDGAALRASGSKEIIHVKNIDPCELVEPAKRR